MKKFFVENAKRLGAEILIEESYTFGDIGFLH